MREMKHKFCSILSTFHPLPHRIQDPALFVDTEQLIGGGDHMQIGLLPIDKVGIWLPQSLHNVHTGLDDVQGTPKLQSLIHPTLSEVTVHLICL